jgi:hypothetical protein
MTTFTITPPRTYNVIVVGSAADVARALARYTSAPIRKSFGQSRVSRPLGGCAVRTHCQVSLDPDQIKDWYAHDRSYSLGCLCWYHGQDDHAPVGANPNLKGTP